VRLLRPLLKSVGSVVSSWPAIVIVGLLFCWRYLNDGVPAMAWADLWSSAEQAGAALYHRDHGLWPNYLYWFPMVSESTLILNATWSSVIFPHLLSMVTRDIWLIVKLKQTFQFVLAGLLMYRMAQEFSKDKTVSLVAAFAYMFSPLMFQIIRGNAQLPWTYALVPLAMLSIYRAFAGGRVYQAIATGVLVSVVSFWGHVESIFHEGIPLFLFCVLQGLVSHRKNETRSAAFLRTAWITGVIWITCILFAMFFVLPSLWDLRPSTTRCSPPLPIFFAI